MTEGQKSDFLHGAKVTGGDKSLCGLPAGASSVFGVVFRARSREPSACLTARGTLRGATMEHCPSTSRKRSPIGIHLVSMLAVVACTRSEHAAVATRGQGATAVSSQQSKTVAAEPSPARAGFDSLIKQQRPGSTCYAVARYVVVERDVEDETGSDLYVRPRGIPDAAPRCDADSSGGDIDVLPGWRCGCGTHRGAGHRKARESLDVRQASV